MDASAEPSAPPSPLASNAAARPSPITRQKSYVCTPKQLEALKKARESRKQRKVTFVESQRGEELDVKHVNEEPKSPVEVVRDDELLHEFAATAKESGIGVTETGLGKKRKNTRPLVESMQVVLPLDKQNLGTWSTAAAVAAAATVGLGAYAWRQRQSRRAEVDSRASAPPPPQSEPSALHLQAPWER